MKPTSRPWHWRDAYNFREHLEHRDTILDSDCENNERGRIQLVNHDGKVVLEGWADYADDSGLEISDADRRFIIRACNSHADLLAACELAVYRLCIGDGDIQARINEVLPKLRAAIEQAGEGVYET